VAVTPRASMQPTLARAMKVGAAATLATIVVICIISSNRSPSVLLSKSKGGLDKFVAKAEGELKSLQSSMPNGRVRSSFPKEEKEVNAVFKHSEASMSKLLKAKHAAKKQITMQQLAQLPSSSRSNLKKLVNEAGYVAAKLKGQLPSADMAAFPKEAKEFRDAMRKEESTLATIDSQLKNSKKANKMTSLHQPSLKQQSLQKRLDADTRLDRKENNALSSNDDVDSVLGSVNNVYHETQSKASKAQMLAAKKAQAKKQKLNGGKAKVHHAPVRDRTGMMSSGAQTWGTIYEPQMAWGQQQGDLIGPAKKEFSEWSREAYKLTHVHDPAKDGTAEGNSIDHWWANKPTDHDQWWTHDHTGRGY